MASRILSITNTSPQVIKVLYGESLSQQSRTAYAYNEAGEISLAPGASTEVEENRIDQGQIDAFRRKNLITTVVR